MCFLLLAAWALVTLNHRIFLAWLKPLFNKLETAHRVHSEISAAFSYAIAHGFTDYDPAQAVAAQIPAQKVKHRAALTEPKDVAQLLRDISSYQGTFIVQCAFRLSPLLFQRPGEIRQMEWKDIDLDAKEWRYFVTKTEVLNISYPFQLKPFPSWKKSSRLPDQCAMYSLQAGAMGGQCPTTP